MSIEKAIYKAMWPNQPVDVCEKHAQAITNVGAAIGLQVPLLPLITDVDCINCVHETPPKKIEMIPRTTGWLCQVYGKSQSDPRRVEKFNISGPKRPDGLAGR